jgi:hypothetical protein
MPWDNRKSKLEPPPASALRKFEKERKEREKRELLAQLEYEARLLKAKVEIVKAKEFLKAHTTNEEENEGN